MAAWAFCCHYSNYYRVTRSFSLPFGPAQLSVACLCRRAWEIGYTSCWSVLAINVVHWCDCACLEAEYRCNMARLWYWHHCWLTTFPDYMPKYESTFTFIFTTVFLLILDLACVSLSQYGWKCQVGGVDSILLPGRQCAGCNWLGIIPGWVVETETSEWEGMLYVIVVTDQKVGALVICHTVHCCTILYSQ